MSEVVKIRGLKSGLQLILDKNAKFDDVKASILDKLTTGNKFFIRGTTVFVDKNAFNETQIEELRRMFHRHGMLFSDKLPAPQPKIEPKPAPKPPAPPPAPKVEKIVSTVMKIDRTLRGGEEIRTESSVIVSGNVNPGAQIIAGGSIDVRGACLGYVHAGAFGDKTAWIIADKLRPIQIRIADLIARPPDSIEEEKKLSKSKKNKRKSFANLMGWGNDNLETGDNHKAERASIKNGYIVFEPIIR